MSCCRDGAKKTRGPWGPWSPGAPPVGLPGYSPALVAQLPALGYHSGLMELDEIDNLSETPADSPLYPHFPMEMRDVEILTVFYRTDAAAVRRLVPRPLEPAGGVGRGPLFHMARAGRI